MASNRIATIKDVAREAGVAISTVSAVVNGNKPVSPELAERVRAAISELNFLPNRSARSLNTKRTKTIAFLTPDISNSAFLRTYGAIDAIVRPLGYMLFMVDAGGQVEPAAHAIRKTIELQVDGVFFVPSWALTHADAKLDEMRRRGIPAVGIGGPYEVDWLDTYYRDERGAGVQLGRYLQRIGHRQILCVGPAGSRAAEIRWGGLATAYEADRSASILYADTKDYSGAGAYHAVTSSIASAERFTAIVGFNDAITTGALAALYDQGLAVPDNVSFVSFGDHHQDFSRPRITSMTFDEKNMAELAARRLLSRIESDDAAPPIHEYLPMTLSVQPSSRLLQES